MELNRAGALLELAGWLLLRKKEQAKGRFPVSQFSYISSEQCLAFAGLKHATQGCQSAPLDPCLQRQENLASCSTLSAAVRTALLCYYFSCCLFLKSRNLKPFSSSLYRSWSAEKILSTFVTSLSLLYSSSYTGRGANHLQKDGLPFTLQSHNITLYFPSFLNNSHYSNHILACF